MWALFQNSVTACTNPQILSPLKVEDPALRHANSNPHHWFTIQKTQRQLDTTLARRDWYRIWKKYYIDVYIYIYIYTNNNNNNKYYSGKCVQLFVVKSCRTLDTTVIELQQMKQLEIWSSRINVTSNYPLKMTTSTVRHFQPPKASCPSSPVDQVGGLHSDTRFEAADRSKSISLPDVSENRWLVQGEMTH